MTNEQYLKNLCTPEGKIDVVLDTDTYNEIDDQFAIAYLLKNQDKLCVKGFCAAPYLNEKSTSPEDGMEKSYNEIFKILKLAGEEKFSDVVFKGSRKYLPDEKTPVESEAASFMAKLSDEYSPEKPLYIVAIGAITNVASAMLKNPNMAENCVIVWLGGNGKHMPYAAREFNMMQDIAAARVILSSGVPFIDLPCGGVVTHFATTKPELEYWLKGKNPLADYLAQNTIYEAESYAHGKPWSRVIWDVTAIAWLVNKDNRFMNDELIKCPVPEYDLRYAADSYGHFIKYVYNIKRDALFEDLFKKLGE